jgi:hypothetical protein
MVPETDKSQVFGATDTCINMGDKSSDLLSPCSIHAHKNPDFALPSLQKSFDGKSNQTIYP